MTHKPIIQIRAKMFILSALTPLFCSLALSFLYLYIYTYKHQRWNSKRFFTIDDSLSMTEYWLVIMSHNCWLMFKAVQSPFFQLLEYFCHFASWWNSLKLQSVARAAVPITPMTISKKNISWWSILIIYGVRESRTDGISRTNLSGFQRSILDLTPPVYQSEFVGLKF